MEYIKKNNNHHQVGFKGHKDSSIYANRSMQYNTLTKQRRFDKIQHGFIKTLNKVDI